MTKQGIVKKIMTKARDQKKHVTPLRMSKAQWHKVKAVSEKYHVSANSLILAAIDALMLEIDREVLRQGEN